MTSDEIKKSAFNIIDIHGINNFPYVMARLCCSHQIKFKFNMVIFQSSHLFIPCINFTMNIDFLEEINSRSYKRSQCSIFDAVLLEEIESSHDRTCKLYLNSVVLSLTLVLILLSELPCLKWANKAIKQITFVLRGLPWFGSTFV